MSLNILRISENILTFEVKCVQLHTHHIGKHTASFIMIYPVEALQI